MKRYVSPFPKPDAYESELLEIFSEECAEVIKRICKMNRFGKMEVQKGQPYNNIQRLSEEVGQLQAMIDLCKENNLLDDNMVDYGYNTKASQLLVYFQEQSDTRFKSIVDFSEKNKNQNSWHLITNFVDNISLQRRGKYFL